MNVYFDDIVVEMALERFLESYREPPRSPSPYLTSEQAAAYMNLAYSTFRKVRKFIRRQPGSGRKNLFKREDLDQYLSESRHRKR